MTGGAESRRGDRPCRVLVADVGNSRVKLAALEEEPVARRGPMSLPPVGNRLTLDARAIDGAVLAAWLAEVATGAADMLVASVHDAAARRLEAALEHQRRSGGRAIHCHRLGHADLPIAVGLAEPGRVGIDRLAAAAAAATLRPEGAGAIVVDCGTAATIDLIDAGGRFLGGAILPGPALQARALEQGTSKLPEVASLGETEPPAMPGRHTREAIAAGIGWGIRGAVGEVVAQARVALEHVGAARGAPVVVTGGWGTLVLPVLSGAVWVPDLVLAGVAMAAWRAAAD